MKIIVLIIDLEISEQMVASREDASRRTKNHWNPPTNPIWTSVFGFGPANSGNCRLNLVRWILSLFIQALTVLSSRVWLAIWKLTKHSDYIRQTWRGQERTDPDIMTFMREQVVKKCYFIYWHCEQRLKHLSTSLRMSLRAISLKSRLCFNR